MATLPNVHDGEYWAGELDPLLTDLDFAFRLAVPQAHRFFTHWRKKVVNRPLLSNLIRYHVLEYLWTQGFDAGTAKEDDGEGWGLRGLPNNGLELLFRQSCIRVRKGIDPPYPNTMSAENFYQQKLFDESVNDGTITNLLILYNLDRDLQYDGKLLLMRPMKLNVKKKTVKCDWVKTVEIARVDPNRVIPPEFMHGQELPFRDEQTERNGKTGTDDKPNGD